MLTSLHIENVALIRRLDLEPGPGFCAFTGETGAGKSILIDSIGLLCGARGERELIRTGEDYALVEGMFTVESPALRKELQELDADPDEDGVIFIQRKCSNDGRSSAKINGRSVPMAKLREIASCLLRIHGQQDTQTLYTEDKQLQLLDTYANDASLLQDYLSSYTLCRSLENQLQSIKEKAEELLERKDLLTFQKRELSQAGIRPGEEEKLQEEYKILSNMEKITENAALAYDTLYASDASAVAQIQSVRSSVNRLSEIIPEGSEIKTRLEDVRLELVDIAETLEHYASGGQTSQTRLLKVEDRLDTLSALEKKYRTDESGLVAKLKMVSEELDLLDNSESDCEELKKQLKDARLLMTKKAEVLSLARKKAAEQLSARIQTELTELDMPKVQFIVRVDSAEPSAQGADDVRFLVSANAGEEPKPIDKIASGGELSRIMLCLQCAIADMEETPTMIFDEIDTGISGKTNEKIGRMLSRVSNGNKTQVICVTHAAQLASCATNHYCISKSEINGRTETSITLLDREGRIAELSRIMGGLQITDTIRKAASELLENAGR